MKTILAIFCIFLAGTVIAADNNGQPANTIEELGTRVAQALIDTDTNALAILMPSYEAYLPVCHLNVGEAPHTEDNLHLCYNRWMGRLRKDVDQFPAEFTNISSFSVDQIDGFNVVEQNQGEMLMGATAGVFSITFTVQKQIVPNIFIRAQCICFSNAWYLYNLPGM